MIESSFTVAYPLLLLLLPVVLILPFLRRKKCAVPMAISNSTGQYQGTQVLFGLVILRLLSLLFLALLVLAAARPQLKTSYQTGEESRRNIMLTLDLSRSMEARDFLSPEGLLQRIDGVKQVTRAFLTKRAGDRVGIVLFGSRSFLQAPLTTDHNFLQYLISEIRLGVAGDGTAMGDGLGVALKRVSGLPADSKAIILLTDGVNNAGEVEPLKAAAIARDLKIKIYTIGIGSREGSYIQLGQGVFGGGRIRAEFDEEPLKKISAMTGGKYFFAADTEDLNRIYEEINQLEGTKGEEFRFEKTEEYGPLLLNIALLSFLAHLLLSQTLFRVLP